MVRSLIKNTPPSNEVRILKFFCTFRFYLSPWQSLYLFGYWNRWRVYRKLETIMNVSSAPLKQVCYAVGTKTRRQLLCLIIVPSINDFPVDDFTLEQLKFWESYTCWTIHQNRIKMSVIHFTALYCCTVGVGFRRFEGPCCPYLQNLTCYRIPTHLVMTNACPPFGALTFVSDFL